MTKIKTQEVRFRDDLYPRIKHNQAKVQEYSECLDLLPPIEVNQHNELIDGFHRWTAHKLKEVDDIPVTITQTKSDDHLLSLAIERNAAHGLQLSRDDKRKMAIRFYASKAFDKPQLSKLLSVSLRSVQEWVSDIDQAEREERQQRIFDMFLACCTAEEIGQKVGLGKAQVTDEVDKLCSENANSRKSNKVTFSEPEFSPPIYNVWTFAKKTNAVDHFGNSEQRIVDNLLWLYTEPFDIVVDPFGGGGATANVCRERLRRYWLSDRKPKAGLENDIRTLDICSELPPLHNRWSDVSLTYLDPPYWRQAQGQYSEDAQDLANMPLAEFTTKLAKVVMDIAKKQKKGAIALLIQPTQWKSETKGDFTDHVTDLIKAVKTDALVLENRISCPYSTEQCTPQMVNWAKENKKCLVLSRELIVWRRINQ